MNIPSLKKKAGFTLIEMLVVIVIIIVLAGIVFRMSRPAGDAALRAKCLAELEMIKTLVEEYHAEFGSYPPVKKEDGIQPIAYEFPYAGGVAMDRISQTKMFKFGLFSFFVARAAIVAECEHGANPADRVVSKIKNGSSALGESWKKGGNDFILEKDDNGIERITDPRKVATFAERVKPDLSRLMKLVGRGTAEIISYTYDGNTDVYTNMQVSVLDPWDRDFVYISEKPYTTYLLFSKGPDGQYDANDPANRSSPKNKDNIYGDIGNN